MVINYRQHRCVIISSYCYGDVGMLEIRLNMKELPCRLRVLCISWLAISKVLWKADNKQQVTEKKGKSEYHLT